MQLFEKLEQFIRKSFVIFAIGIHYFSPMNKGSFLQNKGGYRQLAVYNVAEIIYDITYYFANRYIDYRDRTVDQMIQAARSGKQNIAEGSEASTTSSETEIKLTNVAKASLEELLLDYEDYPRVRGLKVWDKEHPRYDKMRKYCASDSLKKEYTVLLPKLDEEEICNLSITLINQATYLLRRLLERQQQMFLEAGGIREQMTRARIAYRDKRP